jgi:O-antigen ligase
VTAGFSNPNILAIYLLAVFPFALARACDGRCPLRNRLFSSAVLGGLLLCLLLTWSRGAWLGAVMALLAFSLLYSDRTRSLLLLSPLPVTAFLFFLPQNVLGRLSSILNPYDTSATYRRYTWQGAQRMLRAYPMGIGVGEDVFLQVFPRFAVSGTERVMHAHNVILQTACELGIVGAFVGAVWLFLSLFRCFGGVGECDQTSRGVRLAAGCGLLGCLVMGMLDHLWYSAGMLFLLSAVAALGVGERRRNADARRAYV